MEKKNIVSFRSGGDPPPKMYMLPLIVVALRDGISNLKRVSM